MEKTPCYGYCPVYTMQIDRNGYGIFDGVENTDLTGRYEFRIGKEEIELIKALFDNTGFFDLQDRYYRNVTDLPTVYVRYRNEGRDKKIMDYYGAPEKLKDLERQLESLVLSQKMKKTE